MATAPRLFRDSLRAIITRWQSDRVKDDQTATFRLLWSMVAPLDTAVEVILQGLQAAWPGVGTTTALNLIGRSRGLVRGRGETDEAYAARLSTWLEQWHQAGSDEQTARQVQAYLQSASRIRVFRRKNGACVTLNADGSVVRHATTAWDWDSVSHPERAGFWSEIWIVIYAPPYAVRAGTLGGLTVDGNALGHQAPLDEADTLRGVIATWKSAHTRVRAVLWTSDATKFDPATPASMPDGTWGAWGTVGSGSRVASSRDLVSTRYWEL